ncbi:hypothetical protein Apmu_0033_16 [Acidiphilium multivorum AIU301]|uniref:hypothetical protein n=1 Tax=Acidiphilium multivorum TaxID=62140 RepID=UPI0005DBCC0B|nr:hypothetical protein [Acidiphilium multivorum]GAN72843.1 hypothetical protein Apmu_0033_16 [Acidiphilium multivorum AIU301]
MNNNSRSCANGNTGNLGDDTGVSSLPASASDIPGRQAGDHNGRVMKSEIKQIDLSLRQAISEAKSDMLKWRMVAFCFQAVAIIGISWGLLHGLHP